MKKWKKATALLLVGAMTFAMAGCSSEKTNSTSSDVSSAYPKETITLVVPASAGGGTDLSARLWAQYAADKLGVSVVVNNVTGGGGSTGSKVVRDAKADGYTILYWHNSAVLNKITGVSDYGHDGFEMGPGFVYDAPTCVFVQADNQYGWETLEDLVQTALEKPGEITVATEIGSYTYYELLAIQKATGAEFAITDGGSNSEKVTGLLGGAFDVMLNAYSTAGTYVDSGDFLCLGVPTEDRVSQFPDVPTFIEQGYDVLYDGYHFSMFFPEGTPQEIIGAIDEVTKEICEDSEAQAAIEKLGYNVDYFNAQDNLAQYDVLYDYYMSFSTN